MKNFLTKEQLEKLSTQRLLAYKKMMLKYPEGPDWDDVDQASCLELLKITHKKHPNWETAYKNVKEMLATREHITKKA